MGSHVPIIQEYTSKIGVNKQMKYDSDVKTYTS
jgi:hypothetical protein